MSNEQTKDIDPVELLLNVLCFCIKNSGKSFVARLIAVKGDELYFQNSAGQIIMNKRKSLTLIRTYTPDEEVAVV